MTKEELRQKKNWARKNMLVNGTIVMHKKGLDELFIEIDHLQAENAKLRSVLGFFADKENWVCKTPWPHDCKYTHVVTKKACETLRQKAREALGGEK